jgi:hypothetical protein
MAMYITQCLAQAFSIVKGDVDSRSAPVHR